MIYTSYFANLNKLPKNIIPIAICGKSPDWYKGIQYKKLAPKYQFFMKWKENHDNDYYIENFEKQVLNPLSQELVLKELFDLLPLEIQKKLNESDIPWYENQEIHICLICYEKIGDFCHRHLVAYWLNLFLTKKYWIQEFIIK